jgi:hypothetical protein
MTDSSGILSVVLIGLTLVMGAWIIRRLWIWLILAVILFFFLFHGSCTAAFPAGLTG